MLIYLRTELLIMFSHGINYSHLQGNTAPYLQYAVARIHSIFRKVKMDR